MKAIYQLSLAAEADLQEIVRYTVRKWGAEQARIYMRSLKRCAEALAKGSGAHKDMSVLYPNLRMVHCEHHYIFCLPRQNALALIIAIFHERMNIIARVKQRL